MSCRLHAIAKVLPSVLDIVSQISISDTSNFRHIIARNRFSLHSLASSVADTEGQLPCTRHQISKRYRIGSYFPWVFCLSCNSIPISIPNTNCRNIVLPAGQCILTTTRYCFSLRQPASYIQPVHCCCSCCCCCCCCSYINSSATIQRSPWSQGRLQ